MRTFAKLSARDKFRILIFSALYTVLCAKNYRFCFKAACKKSKVDSWHSNKIVMYLTFLYQAFVSI